MKKGTKSKKSQTKEKPKEKPKEKKEESNDEYYTPEEVERLDKFHEQTEHFFEDDEIYELMEKYKNDDAAILNELNEQLKQRKRGVEYEWNEVGKSN